MKTQAVHHIDGNPFNNDPRNLKVVTIDENAQSSAGFRAMLADPTGQIQRECAIPEMKQKDVALTYALAIRDEPSVPVDWATANAAIRARWGMKGLTRVKKLAWERFK